MDGDQCIKGSLGIFLAQTCRLHPFLCKAISELVYDGRLEPHPTTAQRVVQGAPADLVKAVAGLSFVDVRDRDSVDRVATANQREARVVGQVVSEMLASREVVDGDQRRKMQPTDILVVAPYNAHVRAVSAELERRGIAGVRVGTVDRFQGREAPVVVASLCVAPNSFDQADANPASCFS